jgi:small subunit ribosomal protein S3
MADEQMHYEFIENGIQRSQIDEFFAEELGRAGYGGMDLAQTPMGIQIVLKAEKPGMVIGKGGQNIREITQTLEDEFGLEDPQVDVQEVDEPDLNAQIVADRLANALERGWYFRKAGHTTLERIMDAGALGAEIVLSGKVTGARGRVEKFSDGYIKHNGEPAEEIVDRGKSVSVMQLGTIGVNVKIIPPGSDLPDDFHIYEDADTEGLGPEPGEGGVEELLEEPEEGELDELAGEAGEGEESPEEVLEEEIETPGDEDIEEDIDVEELDEAVEEELDAQQSEDESSDDADDEAASDEDVEEPDVDEEEVEEVMDELEEDEQ